MSNSVGRFGQRFALKPLARLGTVSKVRRQDFDRDDSFQAGIFGAIHLSHSARTHSGNDLVGAQTLAGSNRHGSPVKSVSGEYNAPKPLGTCFFKGRGRGSPGAAEPSALQPSE